ncbi:MAG: caspase family protein [Actinomycetota bacterium]
MLWLLLGPVTRTVLFSSDTYEEAPGSLEPGPDEENAHGSVSSDVILAAPTPRAEKVKTPKPVPASRRTALIVGINKAAGSRPLLGAVADAKYLQKALLRYGFPERNVKVLLDGDASRANILAQVASLAERTPRNGVAVFAMASHTRKQSGQNQLVAADGGLISADQLAGGLAAVRSKAWIALPTCYAGGYALPGIVGKNRIATFASPANQPSYELGSAGSYLFINMVRKAMLEGGAPTSVESAFRFAEQQLRRSAPNRVPHMKDGVQGDLVLGPVTWDRVMRLAEPGRKSTAQQNHIEPPEASEPQPTQTPTYRKGIRVCGKISIGC